MPSKKSPRKRRHIEVPVATGPCPFCKEKINPDYKDIQRLSKFVSDRGKILGGKRTGVCAKHQRRLTRAIKRARHLALLAYTSDL